MGLSCVNGGLSVRLLDAADAEAYQAIRVAAATHDPAAIHADAGEIAALSQAAILAQIAPGDGQRVLGAFIDGELIGIAALRRDGRAKIRHRATVQGVFTLPAHRGQGIARALLRALLDEAATLPGLLSLELGCMRKTSPPRPCTSRSVFAASA